MLLKQRSDQTEYKSTGFLPLKIDEAEGIVEHLISVFGVLDMGKDIVHPGAFSKTILERKDQIRVLDAHQRRSILNIVGMPLLLKEISREDLPEKIKEKYPEATGALWAKTQFLMDTPEGKGTFQRLISGAAEEFSFAYDTLDSDETDMVVDGKEMTIRNLRTLRLWEYGPVVFGMNPATTVVGAKDDVGDEGKPAPDVTENTIRIRVRDPKLFQKGTFRTITIGTASKGIKAVIGRLKGKTATSIQSYIFDKSKWTTERARAWVKKHSSGQSSLVENFTSEKFRLKVIDDEGIVVENIEFQGAFKAPFETVDGVTSIVPQEKWVQGHFVFEPAVEDDPAEKSEGELELALADVEQQLIQIALIE